MESAAYYGILISFDEVLLSCEHLNEMLKSLHSVLIFLLTKQVCLSFGDFIIIRV